MYISMSSSAASSSLMVKVTVAGKEMSISSTSVPEILTVGGCVPGPSSGYRYNVWQQICGHRHIITYYKNTCI